MRPAFRKLIYSLPPSLSRSRRRAIGRLVEVLGSCWAKMMLSTPSIYPYFHDRRLPSAICCHRPEIRLLSTFLQKLQVTLLQGETPLLQLSSSFPYSPLDDKFRNVGVAYSFVPFGAVTFLPSRRPVGCPEDKLRQRVREGQDLSELRECNISKKTNSSDE